MDPGSRPTRVPGEYLVTLAPGADPQAIAQLLSNFGIKRIDALGGNIFLVVLKEDPGLARLDELRARNPEIKMIQPNFVYGVNPPGKGQ